MNASSKYRSNVLDIQLDTIKLRIQGNSCRHAGKKIVDIIKGLWSLYWRPGNYWGEEALFVLGENATLIGAIIWI